MAIECSLAANDTATFGFIVADPTVVDCVAVLAATGLKSTAFLKSIASPVNSDIKIGISSVLTYSFEPLAVVSSTGYESTVKNPLPPPDVSFLKCLTFATKKSFATNACALE